MTGELNVDVEVEELLEVEPVPFSVIRKQLIILGQIPLFSLAQLRLISPSILSPGRSYSMDIDFSVYIFHGPVLL